MFFECQICFCHLVQHIKLKLSKTDMNIDWDCAWMHVLKWGGPATRRLGARQLFTGELWVLTRRPAVMGCKLGAAFKKWVLGTQFCSHCREWSQPGLTVQVKIMVNPATEHPELKEGWYRFSGQVVLPWTCHLLGCRTSTVLAPSSAMLVGRSACSNSGVLASKFLLCVGAISGILGPFLFTCLLESISKCWGLGAAFPDRRGQQVRHRSLATGLEKDMTLPERDAREICG